jgi:hypothetical protein
MFLCRIIDHLVTKYPAVNRLHIFTDGAASQFKNKYIFRFLANCEKMFGDLHLSWEFFATSHGKGAVDDVGGTVKRTVAAAVINRQHVVNDARTFANVATSRCRKVNVWMITEQEIEEFAQSQDLAQVFETAITLQGTQNMHSVEVVNDVIQFRKYSAATVPSARVALPSNSATFPTARVALSCTSATVPTALVALPSTSATVPTAQVALPSTSATVQTAPLTIK